MRDTKFRAWDKKMQWMTSIICLNLRDVADDHILLHPKSNEGYSQLKENIEILQYIGFKDINGKEIYEGDVIRMELRSENIIIENIESFFESKGKHESEEYNEDWEDDFIEIIGNIYENPELLENV